jgi:hypothetical protein
MHLERININSIAGRALRQLTAEDRDELWLHRWRWRLAGTASVEGAPEDRKGLWRVILMAAEQRDIESQLRSVEGAVAAWAQPALHRLNLTERARDKKVRLNSPAFQIRS